MVCYENKNLIPLFTLIKNVLYFKVGIKGFDKDALLFQITIRKPVVLRRDNFKCTGLWKTFSNIYSYLISFPNPPTFSSTLKRISWCSLLLKNLILEAIKKH